MILNIFEPGDTIILCVKTSFPDDDKGNAAVAQILSGIEAATAGLCEIHAIHLPNQSPGIEILGVYRPSKSCVCE